MAEFQTQTDIGNLALQLCGAEPMNAGQGFAEDSVRAREVAFSYGKLRRAELRGNVWKFAIRKAPLRPIDTSTMILAPAMWVSTTTYFVGSIVSDQSNNLWISRTRDNVGNDPLLTSVWEPYFGPLNVSLYDSTIAYFAGELVYTAAGDGTNRVYLSLQNANSDNPATATAWSATVTYFKDQVVTRTAVAYLSLIDLNINQDPALSPLPWLLSTTYAINAVVAGSDGVEYKSLAGGNVGHDPVSDAGAHWQNLGILTPWTRTFVGGTGSLKWLQIGGAEFPSGVALTTPSIVYPLGSGPASQTQTLNIYRLPAGYLRIAPQDPKAGSFSPLGAPSNRAYDDWNFEGDYLVSQWGDPIVFRFVADLVDVTKMDDEFCVMLAARLAEAVLPKLAQSSAKLADIRIAYKVAREEAGRANGIEVGPIESALDDYIAARA